MDGLGAEVEQRLRTTSWLTTLGPYEALGQRWVIQTDDPILWSLVDDLYGDLLTECVDRDGGRATATRFLVLAISGANVGAVIRDGHHVGGGSHPAAVLSALVWGINRWVLDSATMSDVVLHAGGVVDADGGALLLPAASGSGKSTLTAGLLQRGMAYLSDEAVVLRPDGTAVGYAKPVSIDRGAWAVLSHLRPRLPVGEAEYLERQWHLRASTLAGVRRAAPLKALVFPRYDPTAPLGLSRLAPSEVVMRAASHTFADRNTDRVELRVVRSLATSLTGIPGYSLRFPDLDIACDTIASLLQPGQTPCRQTPGVPPNG